MIKTVTFSYTGKSQPFIIPHNVKSMTIECFGASGGGNYGLGGNGGYVKGTIEYPKRQTLYIYVGQTGQGVVGGWNGGGNSINSDGHGGGGSSDVRTVDGAWNNIISIKSRIIVAAGGGGSDNGAEGARGGSGGGLTGVWGTGGGCGGPGSQTGSNGPNYGGLGYGGNGSHADAGGGGSGYYGGGGSSGNNAGGGGGSSYYGNLSNPVTTAGVNVGNGKVVITYEYAPLKIFLKKGTYYYIPEKKYFNIYTKTFKALTADDIAKEFPITDDTDISKLNAPFTMNGETFIPSDIIDFNQYSLCVCYADNFTYIPIKSININYTPSIYSLSKTTIKINDKYLQSDDNILNSYLNINAISESNIIYNINYDYKNDILNKNCSLIDTEILKDNFYLSFKFDDSSALLSSITLYKNDSVIYTKIKDNNLNVKNNYENTFITFENFYKNVLVNKITKNHFKYYNNTLDTF